MRIQEAKEILRDAGYSFEKSALREADRSLNPFSKEDFKIMSLEAVGIMEDLKYMLETCSEAVTAHDKKVCKYIESFLNNCLVQMEYVKDATDRNKF